MSAAPDFPENADVETASEEYARRFAGPVGEWFLERQTRSTIELLRGVPAGSRVLDVGGGHAQLTPALVEVGYEVVVLGTAPSCAERLARWIDAGRCRFELGNVIALPYPERSFDAVLCFRLLPHVVAWRRLVGELCRVSRGPVVFDYPSRRSANVVADRFFAAKKRVEGNTRPFALFHPNEIAAELREYGFGISATRPQFVWPMVLHRLLANPRWSRALEAPADWVGATRWLGSPIVVRADRLG